MRRLAIIMLALLAAAALVACGGDDADDGPIVGLLRFIPDTEETREGVVFGDFARIRELAGVEEPAPHLSEDEENAYLEAVVLGPGDGPLSRGVSGSVRFFGMHADYAIDTSNATRAALGFTFADMDRFALVAARGSSRLDVASLYVMQGRFDAEYTASTLDECDGCTPWESGERAGWTSYHWQAGGDLAPVRGPERSAHPDGGPLHLAINDGYVLRTAAADDLHAMIDAREDAASLADDEAWRRLAQELDRLGAVRGEITSTTPDLAWGAAILEARDPRSEPGFDAALVPDRGIPVLRPYLAAALSTSVEDEEVVISYLFLHADATLAEENVARLEGRIEEFRDRGWLTLPDIEMFETYEIARDGELVALRLFGAPGLFPVQSALFLHE